MIHMTLICAVISFLITLISGKYVIKFLRRLKCGQTIYEDGPSWHKDKNGTPTMGGVMFILGVVLSSAVAVAVFISRLGTVVETDIVPVISGLLMALGFSLIGFIDDYIKVVKKRNLGLTAVQKLIFQFLVAAAFLFSLYICGISETAVEIPFIGGFNLGIFYYPVMMLVIVFITNAVNLTDGLDGLASSVTAVCALGYIIISVLLGYTLTASVSAALLGGVMAFLFYNAYPAKVFMGDTGSMFLGGMVVMLAFTLKNPGILILMAGLYIIEALSVVLQVGCYKLTHKRIFLMSPIHHHYEKKGMKEPQIVTMFSAVEFIFVALAVVSAVIGRR